MQTETPAPVRTPTGELSGTFVAANSAPTPLDIPRPKSTPVAAMPDVGHVLLHRWRIRAWAGIGSTANVFRGEHVDLRFAAALKIVNRTSEVDRITAISHLRNEATVLARLRHPNLPRLWDFGEDGPFPCLVTDFIEGSTLGQMIRKGGRVEQRRVLRIGVQIAETLVALSLDAVVHRDIKPANIVLANDGSAKLIDFGLATVHGAENADIYSTRLTALRVGTVAYVSPEQARNASAVDQRADFYSLGATLYHALTGRLPFAGNNAAQMILRHLEDEPVAPHMIVPNLNRRFSETIVKMMSKKPNDRFADAGELLDRLRFLQAALAR